MIRVCSGWSPSGGALYGTRFAQSFDRYWPADVQLQVWTEEEEAIQRQACRPLWSIPGAMEFAARHRDSPIANGREPRAGWKSADRRKGYSFKFDAYKFFKQILIPQAASRCMADGDILVWLDGDVETLRPIPPEFVERLLGDAEVCYLGRERQHSEIGFWALRLNARTREFLREIAALYTTDEFLHLSEWHSAFIWDTARRGARLQERNLVPRPMRGHVWPFSPLARHLRHDKGDRKEIAR